jgi:hypothetical protein
MALLVLVQHALRHPGMRAWSWACAAVAAAAVLVRYQGVLSTLAVATVVAWFEARRTSWRASLRGPAGWIAVGTLVGVAGWMLLAESCGGDLGEAVRHNLKRIAAQTDEPWFHRSTADYLYGSLSFLGPAGVVAAISATIVRRRDMGSDLRLALPLAVVCVHLTFGLVIALKAERYLAPVGPALAVLGSSLVERGLRIRARLQAALVLTFAVAALGTVLASLGRARSELDDEYRRVGAEVASLAAPNERVLLPHVQVAYWADRSHHVSVFESNAEVVLGWLRDRDARITVIVWDDRILFLHPGIEAGDRRRIHRYIAEHFEPVPIEVPHARVFRRVAW